MPTARNVRTLADDAGDATGRRIPAIGLTRRMASRISDTKGSALGGW